ncbi:Sensory box sensor histidine kinaseresponse regulator YwpD [Bacillus mojavensis]|uniref:histidine kinase n=3 Tax=Bacillus mojavensis TaxID=72360 RepID=A0ABX6M1N5_BACMO|nr:Sensory box sensor histidine kinaseresponse regulator YwpD [Bacillus mojavensis]
MKDKFIFISIIFGYAALFMAFIAIDHLSGSTLPEAKHGVMNLENWDFQKDGNVQLNGKWTLYPNQILSPKEIASAKGKDPLFVDVPSNVKLAKQGINVDYGTYKLTIKSKLDNQVFGVSTSFIYSANRSYFNGQVIGQSGSPSNKPDFTAQNRPYTSFFPLHKGDNELVVQFSNFGKTPGWGIAKPITFGTQDQIVRENKISFLNDTVMITAFFITGLYFLGFYLQRKKDKHLLFFSVMCLLFSFIILMIGKERIIFLLFPSISFSLLNSMRAISTVFVSIAVFLYLYFAYREIVSKRFMLIATVSCGLVLIIDFLTVGFIGHSSYILHSVLAVSTLVYITYIFTIAAIRKMEGSLYLTIASISMSAFVILTTISAYTGKTAFSFNSIYSLPTVIALLAIVLLMAQQFAGAFRENEVLSWKLLRVDRLKDEFIAKTSHEFKTPLNSIINICQTLLAGKGKRTIEEEKENMQLVIRMGYRLSNLVNDILDLEKIKQGMLQIHPVPVDIYALVCSEMNFYNLLSRHKNLNIMNHIPDDLPLVLADENRFRQILTNLVDNAIKYTAEGQITLSASKLNDNMIKVTVTDTGSGISEADRQTIFESFQQAEMNKDDGAGLGLSIVKQLVQLQNGDIWVESEEGKGSAFHFTLPIVHHESVPETKTSLPELQSGLEMSGISLSTPYYSEKIDAPTILIVDDNIDSLKILSDMLEGVPYNVIAAKNGTEALEVVSCTKLDLVILDLMMPDMTGFEVCTKIRERFSMVDLPVLIITAAIIGHDKYKAFHAGANDILQKPYHYSEFMARIKNLIMMKHTANQATNMEMAFLQSQIKPHFLYNVLNTIISLSHLDIEKAREITAEFTNYLRMSFDFQNTSAISSFRNELSIINSYLSIEKTRFGDRLDILFDIDKDIDFILPPLMIQPLVENAVHHGVSKKRGGGWVKLTVKKQSRNEYYVEVEDNGVGIAPEKQKNILSQDFDRSVGLKNINQRLKHFCGSELNIRSIPDAGTAVSMVIHITETTDSPKFISTSPDTEEQ